MNDHYRMTEALLKVADEGSVDWEPTVATAIAHATLAAAPPPWLRCIDQISHTGTYPLNPAHVVYFRRGKDGQWWEAVDMYRGYHVIASDEDARIEALIGGRS